MRRGLSLPVMLVATGAGVLAAAVTASSSESSNLARAAGDFSVSLDYNALSSRAVPGTSESLAFTVQASLTLLGNEAGPVRLTVTLPASVGWGRRTPAGTDGCTVTPDGAVCTRTVVPPSGTNRAADFGIWDIVAKQAGTHAFEATVAAPATDVDLSNNTTTLTVRTAPAPAVGVVLRPVRPSAGGRLTASHPVWLRSGNPGDFERATPVGFGEVRCAATIGGAKAPVTGTLRSGTAVCTVRIPKASAGKTLRGTIVTTSGGLSLTKTYVKRIR